MQKKKEMIKCFKELSNVKTFKRQIPNLLTLLRLISPFFIIPLTITGNFKSAGIIALIASFTDTVDGYIARKYNCVSEFGRLLDSVTDKFFAGSLLILISCYYPLLFINLCIEIMIILIVILSQIKGNNPYTKAIGKIKTFFLFIMIFSFFIIKADIISEKILYPIQLLTAILQVLTFISYYLLDKQMDNKKKKP